MGSKSVNVRQTDDGKYIMDIHYPSTKKNSLGKSLTEVAMDLPEVMEKLEECFGKEGGEKPEGSEEEPAAYAATDEGETD